MTENNALACPRLVAWLGYGGLIPFVTLASAVLLDPHHAVMWRYALLSYGAIILTFIGAVHWGLAMSLPALSEGQRSVCFAWSVVPALMAWPTFALTPVLGACLLVMGFVLHYGQDLRLARRTMLPAWYLPLRTRLSGIAILCLVVAISPLLL